ncbi:trypsin-like peptidase domain-containing protein [Schlesneria sp. DSM 10557]|uniref:trypsin-like peptidase domain-containing protein n=1 Tax=Schlesneria sp. DSM 10557 TaxID=3044399 RepID=UPI0035A14885
MPHVLVADSFLDEERKVSYYDVVLPFFKMAADGTPIEHVGTCFPIGIGIYLTAAHNFEGFQKTRGRYKRQSPEKTAPTMEEMVERLEWMKEDKFLEGADVNCGAIIFDPAAIREGQLKPLGISYVTSVLMTLDFDLAVLLVRDDARRNLDGERTPIPCLSLIENPHIGQKIAVAGYPGAKNKFKLTEVDGKPKVNFGVSLVVNEGEITDLYPIMRDVGPAFFPCLQTDIDIAPGQSGGPAFCKETLSVVGINSIGGIGGGLVSWAGKAFDAELLTPIGLTIGGKSLNAGEATTLRELAEAGMIQIFNE